MSTTQHDVPAGYKMTEVGVIPEEWEVVPMAELFTFQNGVNAGKEAYGSGVPFVNVMEVIGNSTLTAGKIPGRIALPRHIRSAFVVQPGDVLFNRTSETQEEVGLASVYLDEEEVVFGGFVLRGKPVGKRLARLFSSFLLRSRVVRVQIISKGQGVVRANVGQRELSRVQIPLPALAEQEAIASVLSDADALIESLEQLVAKKGLMRKAAIQRLFRRGDGWTETPIAEICDVDSTNLGADTQPTYAFKYVSLEQVERGQLLGWTHEVFATAPGRARRRVEEHDILFSTVRPNLQSHCIVRNDPGNLICSTGFSVIRCRRGRAVPYFVFAQLFGTFVSEQIDSLVTGSNYPAISGSDVKRLRILMPMTISEQSAIAAVLSDMDAEIEALEGKLAKARAIKQGMMAELLTGRTRLV